MNDLPYKPPPPGEGLELLHVDPAIVVVVKASGLLAVPGRGEAKQDCATARVRRLLPAMIPQPAVHRLDMATSGLLLLAVTAEAHRLLSEQFATRQVEKGYISLVEGEIGGHAGEITLPLRLDLDNRPRQIHDPERGKAACSRWQLIGREGGRSRIAWQPVTGRTHQLRLHAAHPLGLNAPIVGDCLYGRGSEGEAMLLHATSLRFRHPQSGRVVSFHSPAPF